MKHVFSTLWAWLTFVYGDRRHNTDMVTRSAYVLILIVANALILAGLYTLYPALLPGMEHPQVVHGVEMSPAFFSIVFLATTFFTYLTGVLSALTIFSAPEPPVRTVPRLVKRGKIMIPVGYGFLVLILTLGYVAAVYVLHKSNSGLFPSQVEHHYMNDALNIVAPVHLVSVFAGYHRGYYVQRLFGNMSLEDYMALQDRKNYAKIYDWSWTKAKKGLLWLVGKREFTPSYSFFSFLLVVIPIGGFGLLIAYTMGTTRPFLSLTVLEFFLLLPALILPLYALRWDRVHMWNLQKSRLATQPHVLES